MSRANESEKQQVDDMREACDAELARFRVYRDAVYALRGEDLARFCPADAAVRTPADNIARATELLHSVTETDAESEHYRNRAIMILVADHCDAVDRAAALVFLEQLRESSDTMHAQYAAECEDAVAKAERESPE